LEVFKFMITSLVTDHLKHVLSDPSSVIHKCLTRLSYVL